MKIILVISFVFFSNLCLAEFDRKENMKEIKENFEKLNSYKQSDFKNRQKLENILQESDRIHRLAYSLLANESEYKNDDEFLKLTSDLIGYNKLVRDSILRKDFKNFEKKLKNVGNSCKNCHKSYKPN